MESKEKVLNHRLFTQMNAWKTTINEYLTRDNNRLKWGFRSFLNTLDRLEELVELLNPEDIQQQSLDNIYPHLNNCYSHLANYNRNMSINYLTSYSNAMNIVNGHISHLMIYLPMSESSLLKRISTLRRTLTTLEKKKIKVDNDFFEELNQIKNKYESDKNQIQNLDQETKKLENTVNEYTGQIKGYFDNRAEKFDLLFNDYEKDVKQKLINENESIEFRFKELKSRMEEKQEEFIKFSEEKVDELSRLVDIAGDRGTEAPYAKTALEEGNSATRWRIFTVISMGAFILLSVAIAFGWFTIPESENEVLNYISKFVVFTGLGTLIAYTSKVAAKHKANHRFYRQMAHEFASLSLFMNSLNETDKKDLKKQLVGKYYAQIDNPNDLKSQSDEEAVNRTFKLFESITSFAEKLK